jgi:hypothetical protein
MSDRLTTAFELQPHAVAYASSSLFQMVALPSGEAKKKVTAAPKGTPDDAERSRAALKRYRERAAKALKKQTETPVDGGRGSAFTSFWDWRASLLAMESHRIPATAVPSAC